MNFVYDISEVQYMLFVMIVPVVYLICGVAFGSGGKK